MKIEIDLSKYFNTEGLKEVSKEEFETFIQPFIGSIMFESTPNILKIPYFHYPIVSVAKLQGYSVTDLGKSIAFRFPKENKYLISQNEGNLK